MDLEFDGFDDLVGYREDEEGAAEFADGSGIPTAMTDYEVWENYCDDYLYEMDKRLRAYFKKQRWRRERDGGFKTSASLVFAYLFGRKPTNRDTKATRTLNQLLRYYATRCSKGHARVNNKQYVRVYYFSKYATLKKRPYSLRLRIEEAEDAGKGYTLSVHPNLGKDGRPSGGGRGDTGDVDAPDVGVRGDGGGAAPEVVPGRVEQDG